MSDVFERILVGKLRKELEDESRRLSTGIASDFADYRRRCGKIEGLNFALSFCEEARDEIMGKSRDAKSK